MIRNLVSFSLRDNRNEIRKAHQVWDSCKIKTWPVKPQVLVDHVISIQHNDHFLEWLIVNLKKVNQFSIWIIVTAREEGTIVALNYEVEVHFNQIF